jgi:hypothetical protein
MVIERVLYRKKLSDRDKLIILEIDRDRIDTANAFVDYMSEAYAFSKSSMWHSLNKLKVLELLDFATRNEKGKELQLTKGGITELQQLIPEKAELSRKFSLEYRYGIGSQDYASKNGYADGSRLGYGAAADYRSGEYR